mmetsp:Transcript_15246/g.18856  ORF Transcript_15246/g.18856 Transcript_15246/m.18856 type:complete len:332 (+) Transcript_15246:185-1180(+)
MTVLEMAEINRPLSIGNGSSKKTSMVVPKAVKSELKKANLSVNSSKKPQFSFKIVEEPVNTFYKDEGGKSNHLTVVVLLSLNKNPRDKITIGNVVVSPKLVYESGKEVEDADEIFNILSMEPQMVTSTNQPFKLDFRIEKVSRRKDGKKFKVRFDVEAKKSNSASGYSLSGIDSVTTSAIVVLSKRKLSFSGTSSNGSTKHGVKRKPSSKKDDRTVELPVDVYKKITETIRVLESAVTQLNDRVTHLENENPKRERIDDEFDRFYHQGFEGINYLNRPSKVKQQRTGNPLSYIQPMDVFEEDIKGHKRGRNGEVVFDFGIPTGSDREFFCA